MKCKVQQKNVNPNWFSALQDAKRKHSEGRAYVSRMRAIIRGIERKIAAGEDFPGEKQRSQ